MRSKVRGRLSLTALLILSTCSSIVRSAINLDGSQAVDPAPVDEDDAAPIDGMDVYWPDQHDCPLPCVDYSNIHSWIPYLSVQRLQRCQQPMLLQFSAMHPLEDSATTILIRSCTLGSPSARIAVDSVATVDNPKTAGYLYEPSLDVAPACRSDGTRVKNRIHVSQMGNSDANDAEVSNLLEGMQSFFNAADNCDESFLFAHHNNIVASLYIGKGLAKKTAQSALKSLANRVRNSGSIPQRTVAEDCTSMHDAGHIFGVAIDVNGALSTVQNIAFEWSQGRCARNESSSNAAELSGAEVWETTPSLQAKNGTINGTNHRHSGNNTAHQIDAFLRPLNRNSTRLVGSFIKSVSSLLMGTGSAVTTAKPSNIPTQRILNSSKTAGSERPSTVLPFNTTSSPSTGRISQQSTILTTTIETSSISESTNGAAPIDRTSSSHSTSRFTSSSVGRNSTSTLSSSTNSKSSLTSSMGSSTNSARTPTRDRSTDQTEGSSSTKKTMSNTESSARPTNTVGDTLTGKGILSCKGGYQIRIDNRLHTYNNTLSCNGTLLSNGTLNCAGAMKTPRNLMDGDREDFATNGTLSCNGTLHNNGTIKGNVLTSCNGTLSITSTDFKYPGINGTLSCNGTLGGNGTFEMQSTSRKKRQASGTCATHLIQNGDTCFVLGEQYDTTVEDIESWNKGKTWGWQGCADLLVGYVMCVGPGGAPMPAPQQGTQCGPLVPGTRPPTDPSISLADLNPCPLKACCSNWGFCGVFPGHCTVNAPAGAAPGAKNKDAQNTCVSNCGTAIKQNSGPPASFGRVGYYSAFAYGRKCLHLPARGANTDGSYTIIHWAFAEIDPSNWKVVINDPGKQWQDFKDLLGVKRVLSFGGWAYSTEPATYNIIRQAILTNYEEFTNNLVKFVQDEGLDGVDIDWEYPGAPDILVNGQPIGHRNDGRLYLRFLRVLRSKLGNDKLLAIAAPASFWYLKAFPIDTMATVLDYIVYMTYDLHGQWDHGNPNAFDNCDSGKCIRSHVNLTETRNALGMVTKAGVPTNKIFVGEASYGRSFHMAQPGCWGEMCEFTGSRTQSDATPGRCTNTGGYLALAEIEEILMFGRGEGLHDSRSNSDILLYNNDYISYMTTTTKDTRRENWRRLNFAGSIDWALDLQSFTSLDSEPPPDIPDAGEDGCVLGDDLTLYTGDLCRFTCEFGFCPDGFCECQQTGPVQPRPSVIGGNTRVVAVDDSHVVINQLCVFAYKYGYFDKESCEIIYEQGFDRGASGRPERNMHAECLVFKDVEQRDVTISQCFNTCQKVIEKAREENRTTNYGCLAIKNDDGVIPWSKMKGTSLGDAAPGRCLCDNSLINEIVDTVIESLPIIAQIGCAILMQSLRFVLDVALMAFPPGRVIHAGLDMLLTAVDMINYVYPEDENPGGAFDWWLSPCGGGDLLPDEVREAFEIMSLVGEGVSSFIRPRNGRPGSGREGDEHNPNDQSTPRAQPGPSNNPPKNVECKTPGIASPPVRLHAGRSGGWHVAKQSTCGANKRWTTNFYSATSALYPANGRVSSSTGMCGGNVAGAACRGYSSAISVSPAYAVQTCPPEQAKPGPDKMRSNAVRRWNNQHSHRDWRHPQYRAHKHECQIDEWPPAYLLGPNLINQPGSQLVRYIPHDANGEAGSIWKGYCIRATFQDLTDVEFARRVVQAGRSITDTSKRQGDIVRWTAAINVEFTPVFEMGWQHQVLLNDGLDDNACYPSQIAPNDAGFALLDEDPYNAGRVRPYNYKQAYQPGVNGV